MSPLLAFLPKLIETFVGRAGGIIDQAITDTDLAAKLKADIARESFKLARAETQADTQLFVEINRTMRSEIANGSKFQSSWRPLVGYVLAVQLGLLGLAVFSAIGGAVWTVFSGDAQGATALLSGLATVLGALVWIIAAEAAVLGVNIKERTATKAMGIGVSPPPSLFASLAESIARRKETKD